MTKKKNTRSKHQKDVSLGDTSEEEFNAAQIHGKSCPHVSKGIHLGRVKKSLKSTQSIITCSGCSNETANEELPEIWFCLQCGYRGCGRMSENKHGLQHFKTLHSDCHSLVLSTTSGSVWCYDCDDEISLQLSSNLKQCVEFVMKMSPSGTNRPGVPNKSLQNSVIKEETCVQNTEEKVPIEKSNKSVKNKENSEKLTIKGLRNLGNTCFFNAVMQNLNQTPLLYHELKNTCTPSHLWQVPELFMTNNEEITESNSDNILKLSLPRQFPLTTSLLNFFEDMNSAPSSKVEIVNPSLLFGEISKKCPQFRHFQQQDSHELLRQLLDGVRQEEIKRQKKAILRYFDLENVSPENVDEDMKKQIKAYSSYASHSIVEKVFGGLLISTVLCEECKASSQVFEPFMDLSLPLFEEKQQENNEQLYGMLDGGKQDHIKPLRNKKNDWEAEDNTNSDYVLSKPKNDLVKPSKYQEKKQKLLAKKEKKRSKYGARNRKNSQNESGDNSVCNQINETKDVDNEEDNNKDSEDPDDVDNQNEDTLEIEEVSKADKDNSKKDSELLQQTYSSNVQVNIEKSNNLDVVSSADLEDSESTLQPCGSNIQPNVKNPNNVDIEVPANIEESQVGMSDKSLVSCPQTTDLIDPESILQTCNSNIQVNIKKAINVDIEVTADIEESQVGISDTSLVSCSEVTGLMDVEHSPEIQSEVKHEEIELKAEKLDQPVMPELADDTMTEVIEDPNKGEGIVNQNETVKDSEVAGQQIQEPRDISVESAQNQNVAIEIEECAKNQVDVNEIKREKTEESAAAIPIEDDTIGSLTENFNNYLKLDSNEPNMDDRIQALSMQIKDVRIRRDSDRKENLLNSSESADDYESQKTSGTSPKSSVEDSCSVENLDNWSHSVSEQQTKDWISKTLTTLKARHHVSPLECSVNSCLTHFTKPELLTGNNKFRCENCTGLKIKKTGNKKDVVYSNASKQMLVFSPPAVLTLHLKRFQQVGMSLRKVNRFVEFPLILDLSPYCCSACLILPHMSSVDDEILYSLYGIVEHSGRLTSGHYTAYVKSNKRTVNRTFECQLPLAQCDLEQLLRKFSGANRVHTNNSSGQTKEDCQWFYISDSHVNEVSEAQVLKCQAYLLFYERIK